MRGKSRQDCSTGYTIVRKECVAEGTDWLRDRDKNGCGLGRKHESRQLAWRPLAENTEETGYTDESTDFFPQRLSRIESTEVSYWHWDEAIASKRGAPAKPYRMVLIDGGKAKLHVLYLQLCRNQSSGASKHRVWTWPWENAC